MGNESTQINTKQKKKKKKTSFFLSSRMIRKKLSPINHGIMNRMRLPTLDVVVGVVFVIVVVIGGIKEASAEPRLSLAERMAALRQSDDSMQFKKGVRGECFETYLQLEDNAKEEAKKMMYEMEGWHQLAKDDGNWRTVIDAVAKEEAEIEEMKSVIEKSEALERIDPIVTSIKDIKNYQREMTKQMLKVVKLAEKFKYVKYFASLDYIGKKELPCVKAIQESYASKYPVLLNQVPSEVMSATESELATGKTEMKTMIDEYGKKLKKLTDDATKNTEIGPYMKAAQASPSDIQQQRQRQRQQEKKKRS